MTIGFLILYFSQMLMASFLSNSIVEVLFRSLRQRIMSRFNPILALGRRGEDTNGRSPTNILDFGAVLTWKPRWRIQDSRHVQMRDVFWRTVTSWMTHDYHLCDQVGMLYTQYKFDCYYVKTYEDTSGGGGTNSFPFPLLQANEKRPRPNGVKVVGLQKTLAVRAN